MRIRNILEVNVSKNTVIYINIIFTNSKIQEHTTLLMVFYFYTFLAWGFGFLCVTIINVCSLSGAIVLPCMKKTIYRKVLIFLVALAVGSLAASALLVLIPEVGLLFKKQFLCYLCYNFKM